MANLVSVLERGLEELGISISPHQKKQCEQFAHLLVEWNKKINLTAIKGERDIAIKHFIDSFAAGQYLPLDKLNSVLDLGAGAGFPGLVLKIWQPLMPITLVDAVQKKVEFMKLVIEKLGLQGADAFHGRAEDLGRDERYREKYSLVMARAVAPFPTLSEYCLPLLAPGGYFCALKGPGYEEELREAESAIGLLGGIVDRIHQYSLPLGEGQRSLVIIQKISSTPKAFPRKSGLPKKRPITINFKPD